MYTDHLGNPINVGDILVRSITSGYGSDLVFERVAEILPLVEKPGNWHSTGTRSDVPLVRADQVNKARATEYRRPGPYDYSTGKYGPVDPSKFYVLRTARLDQKRGVNFWVKKTTFVANISNVVVVTSLAQNLHVEDTTG